jgi:hypothetical protein
MEVMATTKTEGSHVRLKHLQPDPSSFEIENAIAKFEQFK